MDLKAFFELIDRRTLGAASMVVAVFVIIVLLAGYFTRDSLLPMVLDHIYHISTNIEKDVVRDLSVGYSRTFIFNDYATDQSEFDVPQTLLFTLSEGQTAEILLSTTVAKRTGSDEPIPISVSIDSAPIRFTVLAGRQLTIPFPNGQNELAQPIDRQSVTSEQYLLHAHSLSIQVLHHKGKALIAVDALVEKTGTAPQAEQ